MIYALYTCLLFAGALVTGYLLGYNHGKSKAYQIWSKRIREMMNELSKNTDYVINVYRDVTRNTQARYEELIKKYETMEDTDNESE